VRQFNEAENVLEEDVGSGKTFSEIKEELIDADMKRYGTVTFETAKKIMEMNNKEVRRKMGLPPE
jgi:adenylate kinase